MKKYTQKDRHEDFRIIGCLLYNALEAVNRISEGQASKADTALYASYLAMRNGEKPTSSARSSKASRKDQ